MTKRLKENLFFILLMILLSIYFYFNVNYLDRYVIDNAAAVKTSQSEK